MTTVEGVAFVNSAVKRMSREDFIKMHIGVFWQNRPEADRKKMLSDTYDLIVGEEKKKK